MHYSPANVVLVSCTVHELSLYFTNLATRCPYYDRHAGYQVVAPFSHLLKLKFNKNSKVFSTFGLGLLVTKVILKLIGQRNILFNSTITHNILVLRLSLATLID